MAFTVTKDTIIGDIMDADENTGTNTLWKLGMHCLFCPVVKSETLEEACAVHIGVPVGGNARKAQQAFCRISVWNYFRRPAAFQGRAAIFFFGEKALDKRLVTCAKLCTGDFVCDVGTDHGYPAPCFMIKENMCKKALACDVDTNAAKVG